MNDRLLALLALLVCACGGGAKGKSAPPANTPPPGAASEPDPAPTVAEFEALVDRACALQDEDFGAGEALFHAELGKFVGVTLAGASPELLARVDAALARALAVCSIELHDRDAEDWMTPELLVGRSPEAMLLLLRVYQGARAFYMDGPRDAAGEPSVPSLSAGPMPADGCCARAGGVCDPDVAIWNVAPWESLRFSIDVRHRFSVEYQRLGRASFVVRAVGDRDCDGVKAVYEMRGEGTGEYKLLPQVGAIHVENGAE